MMNFLNKAIFIFACSIFLFFFSSGQQQCAWYNVKTYGAVGNGTALDTKAINETIAACVAAGGGTVYFPSGTYVAGSFRIFSNVHVYLDAGAVLLASPNDADYFWQKDYGFSGSGAGEKTGIIFAHGAENVSVSGQGTIDGRGPYFMYMDSLQYGTDFDKKFTRQGNDYMDARFGREDGPVLWKGDYQHRPGTAIIFSSCKKVDISGITIKDAANWSMDILACNDAKITGISIKNNMAIPNSDGIDLYDSKNVMIANCDIQSGDDAIAVIGSSNVTVTNCELFSRSSGIRIGYNAFNDSSSGNLLFDNIRIYGSNRGIGIFQRRKGDMRNMIFSNIIIDTRLHSGQWWGHGEPIHISALPGIGSKEVGEISNVRFSNIIASGEQGIVLYGSKESVLKDIRFDHVQLTLKKGPLTLSYGGNFDLRPANDISMGIFKHDIPALYANHIKGLSINGLELKWEKELPVFFTYALECENFEELYINELSAGAVKPSLPAIKLSNGKGATIKAVSRDDKAAQLLEKIRVDSR